MTLRIGRVVGALALLMLSATVLHGQSTNFLADPNIQLAYLFKEGSGTTVADATVNGRTGTFNASGKPAWSTDVPTYGVSGSAKGSVSFAALSTATDAISDSTSDLIAPYNGAFSFVAWIKATQDTNDVAANPKIFERDSVTFAVSTTNCLEFNIFATTGTSLDLVSANNTLSLNTWHHISITGNGSTTVSNYHIYIDGAETTYQSTTNGVTVDSNAGGQIILGNVGAANRALGGKLTDIAFFNRQLSASEVLSIYRYGLNQAICVFASTGAGVC